LLKPTVANRWANATVAQIALVPPVKMNNAAVAFLAKRKAKNSKV